MCLQDIWILRVAVAKCSNVSSPFPSVNRVSLNFKSLFFAGSGIEGWCVQGGKGWEWKSYIIRLASRYTCRYDEGSSVGTLHPQPPTLCYSLCLKGPPTQSWMHFDRKKVQWKIIALSPFVWESALWLEKALHSHSQAPAYRAAESGFKAVSLMSSAGRVTIKS